jgi:hypothetical protein
MAKLKSSLFVIEFGRKMAIDVRFELNVMKWDREVVYIISKHLYLY